MVSQNIRKSGYQGDTLIGYRGWCWRCGQERRVYFAKCRDDIKRKMLDGLRKGEMNYQGSCEVCIPEGLHGSVTKWFLMSQYNVDRDLAIVDKTMNIDFSQFENDLRENTKNDKWLDDNEKHVEDYKKFRKKHDPFA